jgi:hypothetical protein
MIVSIRSPRRATAVQSGTALLLGVVVVTVGGIVGAGLFR